MKMQTVTTDSIGLIDLLGSVTFGASGHSGVHIWHLHLNLPDSNRLQPQPTARQAPNAQRRWSEARSSTPRLLTPRRDVELQPTRYLS